MARSDFGPEVKAAQQTNASPPRQPPAPRTTAPPKDSGNVPARDSATSRGGMPGMPHTMPPMQRMGPMPVGSPAMPSGSPGIPHVAAAASIAHAILGNRGLR